MSFKRRTKINWVHLTCTHFLVNCSFATNLFFFVQQKKLKTFFLQHDAEDKSQATNCLRPGVNFINVLLEAFTKKNWFWYRVQNWWSSLFTGVASKEYPVNSKTANNKGTLFWDFWILLWRQKEQNSWINEREVTADNKFCQQLTSLG